eukprot:198890-Chlamydomonas_euryale.AAC.4
MPRNATPRRTCSCVRSMSRAYRSPYSGRISSGPMRPLPPSSSRTRPSTAPRSASRTSRNAPLWLRSKMRPWWRAASGTAADAGPRRGGGGG